MAQVNLLKVGSDGIPLEFDTASDEITLVSFTAGIGPVMSATGVDFNNTSVTELQNLNFNAPSTGYINATAGNLIVDDIMGKERSNVMTTASDILFPVIADNAGQVDIFRLPSLAGAPSATPTTAGEGYIVWDSTNDYMYVYNGSAWKNMSIADAAAKVQDSYTAGEALTKCDFVYISANDTVSKAQANAASTSYTIGAVRADAASAAPVQIEYLGKLDGFTGLVAGTRYYLSASVAGGYQNSVPTGTGNRIILVGKGVSTDTMLVNVQELGTRA